MCAETEGSSVGLELWHPSGVARRRLGLGAAARDCDTGPVDDSEPVDLVLVAPARDESGAAWFNRALDEAGSRAVDDGIVWVVAARRWRRVARRAATRAGLTIDRELVLVPPWPRTDHFVELAAGPLRDAGRRHLGLGRVRASIVAALARTSAGRTVIRRTVPGHAFVAVRDASATAMAWLDGDRGRSPTSTTLGHPAEGGSRMAVVLRYPDRDHNPNQVVKVALDIAGRRRLRREREALVQLGPFAARAGASVPRVATTAGNERALETSVVPGRPIATLLTRRPDVLGALTAPVVAWLLQWNRLTATKVDATAARLDELVVARLDRVLAVDDSLAPYRDRVATLAARLAGAPLTTVATHNDLTMANVLADSGRISVVDWEAAGHGMPGTDLWYMLTDAVATAAHVDRPTAVRAVVHGTGAAAGNIADAPARLRETLGLSAEEACLAFHACWADHAANEVEREVVDGPFLAVVRAVAREGMFSTDLAAPEDPPCGF